MALSSADLLKYAQHMYSTVRPWLIPQKSLIDIGKLLERLLLHIQDDDSLLCGLNLSFLSGFLGLHIVRLLIGLLVIGMLCLLVGFLVGASRRRPWGLSSACRL